MVQFKKTICFLLILAFCASPANVKALESESDYASEAAFLKAIKVLDEDFNLGSEMTKGGFLSLIVKILCYEGDITQADRQSPPFADVNSSSQYYDGIKFAKELGIVAGADNHNFYPDNPITLMEAYTIVINALGYKVYADAYGGYPSGYLRIANNTNLSRGIGISGNETLTGAYGAKLIYNALFVDYITIRNISSNGADLSVNHGLNILSERLRIKEYDAQLTDNGFSSMRGSSLGDESRVAFTDNATGNMVIAYANDTGIGEYLGYRLKIFVRNDPQTGRDEIIYFDLHNQVRTKTLNAASIMGKTGGYIEYESVPDSGKFERYNLSGIEYVILNGVYYYEYDDLSTLIPEDGFITLISNNGGGYGVINILSFNIYDNNFNGPARNIVVDKADAENKVIFCKFNPQLNINLDGDDIVYRFTDNSIKNISDLQEFNIVSVAQSPVKINNKTLYLLAVSKESADGKISAVNTSRNELTVNNKIYAMSGSLLSVKSNYTEQLAFGNDMTFYLDAVGKIAYIYGASTKSKNYGYLINFTNNTNSVEGGVIAKIFTLSGEIKIFTINPKAIIDGAQRADIVAALTARPAGSSTDTLSRPIIYEVGSKGDIVKIDTDNLNYDAADGRTAYSNQTHIPYSIREIDDIDALKAGYRSPRIEGYSSSTRTVGGKFNISSDTVILCVPDIDIYGLDKAWSEYNPLLPAVSAISINRSLVKEYEKAITDDNYKIMSVTDLDHLLNNDIQGYDIDPDTGIASLVVLRGNSTVLGYRRAPYNNAIPLSVFLKTTSYYDDENDKTITKIYYTSDGINTETALADMDNLLFTYKYLIAGCGCAEHKAGVACDIYNIFTTSPAIEPLAPGDVIRLMTQRGHITYLERVYNYSKLSSTVAMNMYPTNQRYVYTTNLGGINAYSETYGMPNDVCAYWAGASTAYYLGIVKPNFARGSVLQCFLPQSKMSTMNLSIQNTYSDVYYTIPASLPILHVSISKIANPVKNDVTSKLISPEKWDIKVTPGSISDIKTYRETNDLNKASTILVKVTNARLEQMIIVNEEGN